MHVLKISSSDLRKEYLRNTLYLRFEQNSGKMCELGTFKETLTRHRRIGFEFEKQIYSWERESDLESEWVNEKKRDGECEKERERVSESERGWVRERELERTSAVEARDIYKSGTKLTKFICELGVFSQL